MKPIDDMVQCFSFEPQTPSIVPKMEKWLNDRYPEAKWTITLIGAGCTVNCYFANETERTFYTLKWA
jgi:hypothetical protein